MVGLAFQGFMADLTLLLVLVVITSSGRRGLVHLRCEFPVAAAVDVQIGPALRIRGE